MGWIICYGLFAYRGEKIRYQHTFHEIKDHHYMLMKFVRGLQLCNLGHPNPASSV